MNGKDTFHVQMAPRKHKMYEHKLEDLCRKFIDRLAWLKDGSREMFGTLLENKVVIAIDTSFSLKERLPLIKQKVQQLLKVRFYYEIKQISNYLILLLTPGASDTEERVHNSSFQF